MKINWTTLKIALAFVVIIGVIFWAANTVRTRSYSGADLSFDIGGGTVTMTNPSDEAVPVQIVSTGSRSFRMSSSIEDVSGSSTREGSGAGSSQFFEFDLPAGESEFTISRGEEVRFTADTDTRLEATVHPVDSDSQRIILVSSVAVILGALFFASNAVEHRWINMILGKETAPTELQSAVETASSTQGQAAKTYGDNRK